MAKRNDVAARRKKKRPPPVRRVMFGARAGDPCPRCLPLVRSCAIRAETLQPLRGGALDSIASDGSKRRQCRDCKAAETLQRLGLVPRAEDQAGEPRAFEAARIVTGNERQEALRLPGAPMGLRLDGLVEHSEVGELEQHQAWLDAVLRVVIGESWEDVTL